MSNDRTPTGAPRADGSDEWEAFVRPTRAEPLRHVGSVSAPTAETAHEAAGRLVPDAHAVWLCPTDAVERFDERSLAGTDVNPGDGENGENGEGGGEADGGGREGDTASVEGRSA
ncbi:MAG: Htur_1727 family rSAM-partnered candidate RiPP [Haloarculaceae archaeon]